MRTAVSWAPRCAISRLRSKRRPAGPTETRVSRSNTIGPTARIPPARSSQDTPPSPSPFTISAAATATSAAPPRATSQVQAPTSGDTRPRVVSALVVRLDIVAPVVLVGLAHPRVEYARRGVGPPRRSSVAGRSAETSGAGCAGGGHERAELLGRDLPRAVELHDRAGLVLVGRGAGEEDVVGDRGRVAVDGDVGGGERDAL